MPLVTIHVLRGRSDDELRVLLDAIQDAQVEAFDVPAADRYQVLTQHDPIEMQVLDTGLGYRRTSDLVVLHVVSRERTEAAKTTFYDLVARNLQDRLGIDPEDLVVAIAENDAADWSFGRGRAQFLTGEL